VKVRRPARIGEAPSGFQNFVSKKEAAKERLERNLKSLEAYCQPPVDGQAEIDEQAENPIGEWQKKQRVLWPSHELLRQIDDDVIELAIAGRKKPILPIWKAFEQADRRMRKFRLKLRLEALIRRAGERVTGESELAKAARELEAGNAGAQCLVRDILCETRSLRRLLEDDHWRIVQKAKSYPLLEWLIVLGHPMAKDFWFGAEYYVVDAAVIKKRSS